MNANIIDGRSYTIKQVVQYEEYSFRWDINYSSTSSITIIGEPQVEDGDYIIAFDAAGRTAFQGICSGIQQAEGGIYQIQMRQIECLFNRQIILQNETLAQTSGIEAFIVQTIEDNFSASGDAVLDLGYLQPVAGGDTTPYEKRIPTEDGIYNLATLLGNLKEKDGLFTRFSFDPGQLTVYVEHPAMPEYNLNLTGVSDVFEVAEDYSIDVLARLNVRWKIPDNDQEGYIGATTFPAFFFRSDGSVTIDQSDANRVTGQIDATYIEEDLYQGLRDTVTEHFRNANSYNHQIHAKIYSKSRAYPWGDLFVGRTVGIRARKRNLRSIITEMEKNSSEAWYSITFGMLPVYLTDKIARRRR